MTTTPDPRPVAREQSDGWTIAGHRCATCGHPSAASPAPMRCMRCNGPLNEATFGPRGRIWSSTVVRVPVPGRTPPYALAYIDLDDGPRVLAHVVGAVDRPTVGAIVRVAGQTADGDLAVEVVR